MKRFVIFTFNTATNNVVLKESFNLLADADAYFVKGTVFNSIANWVESYGHYSCNSLNFNYYERPELIILLDIQYEFPENETNTYVAIEFHKFRNALINRTEEPTVYLESNSTLTSENKEQFSNLGNILYYPGAFTDFGPMKFFFENSSIDTVIYTDYMITREILEERIQNFIVGLNNPLDIEPTEFNKNNWNEFWPEGINQGINNAFGIEYNFLINNDKKCRFIYLATEAIKTYSILLECNLVPDVIVLQDHGMGGNWTRFSGDSPLYSLSLAVNNLPKYIFLEPGGNTNPWQYYNYIAGPFDIQGAMHNNRRSLYKKN